MPELKIARSYHEFLRRIGVQNPGEVGVATPVQLTIPLDAADHLISPIQVPVVGFLTFTNASAAESSGFEIEARAGGFWLEYLNNDNSDQAVVLVTDESIADFVDDTIVGTNFGPPAQSIIREVRVTALVPGNNFHLNQADVLQGLPFFVPRGQFLSVYRQDVNNSSIYRVWFREVPVGGIGFEGPQS